MTNVIETAIRNLEIGQSIFLGHSSVIANVSGIRVGFDLSTKDGKMNSPFFNFVISDSDNNVSHLIPLIDTHNLVPRPHEIADALDLVIYTHLHSDHFSLKCIAELREVNPQIRIICPPNTKKYLSDMSKLAALPQKRWFNKIKIYLAKNIVDIKRFAHEITIDSKKRDKLISSIDEISSKEPITITVRNCTLTLSAFPTTHPAYQLYFQSPLEPDFPPPVLGYKLAYQNTDFQNSLIFIGESASDPELLSHVFNERENLSILFFPITEQIESTGGQFIQEFMFHSSLRTLALVEKIVSKNTKIVPLHQGLWYFRLTSPDIVKARESLEKLASKKSLPLPFVSLSREFQSINKNSHLNKSLVIPQKIYVSSIFSSIWERWSKYKRLAEITSNLPISGSIVGFTPGTVVDFNDKSDDHADCFAKETLESSIQAFLTEFQILHGEIDRSWSWQSTTINYILLVMGSVFTLVSAFPNQQLLFLVASYVLTALGSILVEKSDHMIRIGRYFHAELVPRINYLSQKLENIEPHNPKAEKIRILLWEGYFRGGNIQTLISGIAGWGRFALAAIPGFAFALVFYNLKQSSGSAWTSLESLFMILAFGLSAIPLLIFFLNARFSFTGKQ